MSSKLNVPMEEEMAKEPKTEEKRENKTIFRSAYGKVAEGSYKKEADYSEITVMQGDYPTIVRGYKDHAKKVDALNDSKGEVLIRGALLGSKKKNNVHIAMHSSEPMEVKGKVYNLRRSGEGKMPAINGFVVREVEGKDGKTYKFGTPFRVFGQAAEALAGMQNGDYLTGSAREVVNKRGEDNAPEYIDAIELMGEASFATPEPEASDDLEM